MELIESIAAMPIEAVKEELQQRGLNFKEALPDRISQQISVRACQSASEQNVTSESLAFIQKTNPPKSDAQFLLQRLLHKWALKPLILQLALFVLGLLCATAILFLVTNTDQWLPKADLSKLKRIYVKTSDDDLLSIKARDNIIRALKAKGTLTIVEKSEDADVTLNLFVKQNAENKEPGIKPATKNSANGKAEGSQTMSITVQIIKREPKGGNNSFERNYTGPIDEVTSTIVGDLLLYIRNSGER
jgi:hypothetical protein